MEIEEEWRIIPGTDGFYEASSLGRIRSVERECHRVIKGVAILNRYKSVMLSQSLSTKGGKNRFIPIEKRYLGVGIRLNGRQKRWQSHRLIVEAFLPPDDTRVWINHKDGNPQNNRIENLERCTPSENNWHTWNVLSNARKPKGKINYEATHRIAQLTLDGEFVAEWPSAMSAQRSVGGYSSTIIACVRGVIPHYRGFKWALLQV